MGFHSLLERLGFVRLRDFGLILTPDRRVVTTRPILDDGFGATVVGWEGSDLAAIELPVKGALAPPSVPEPPRPTARPAALISALAPAPPVALPPVLATPPTPTPAVPEPHVDEDLGEDEEPGEDEWEWEIAMARARAIEAEADTVPAPVVAAPPAPAPRAPAPRATTPHTTSPWLTAEPLTGRWQEDTAIRSVTQLARASEQQFASNATPRTIIPVPSLPVARDPSRVRLDDVTRPLPVTHRFARGTASRAAANDDTATTAVRVRRS